MILRRLWSPTLSEWVLGALVASGCIAPSAGLGALLGGQSMVSCAGSVEIDCAGGTSCQFSGEMPHFCACDPRGPGSCSTAANPCVPPCYIPMIPGSYGTYYIPGHCNHNDSCYY